MQRLLIKLAGIITLVLLNQRDILKILAEEHPEYAISLNERVSQVDQAIGRLKEG